MVIDNDRLHSMHRGLVDCTFTKKIQQDSNKRKCQHGKDKGARANGQLGIRSDTLGDVRSSRPFL